MARKCGRCRKEGHTIKTCTEASDVQHRAETRAMDAAIVASHVGSAQESATEDGGGECECGRATANENGVCDTCASEPAADHRKWCTRCKLIGHYAADCTTAVLEGGTVSVPVSPGVGLVSVPVVDHLSVTHVYTDSSGVQWTHPGLLDECEVPDCCTHPNGFGVMGCPCGASDPGPEGQDCPGCDHWTHNDSGRCDGCTLEMASAKRAEPDPFSDPTPPTPDVNVSGQPRARYEWHGKQNRGYLVKLPETGDFRRYKNGSAKGIARATTFNKAATDSTGLTDWAKRNVLIGASKRPDIVAKAHGMTHEDNRGELMSLVAELEETAGAKVSADVGTLIHELTERWDAGQLKIEDIPAAYRPLILLYDKTIRDAGLVPVAGLIERTTYISEFDGVVGTLDRVYYHERSGQYLIGDVKTGKTLKYGMDEIETQEWIYAHGVNQSGVYDWNTDTWQDTFSVDPRDPNENVPITVSEEWGVVVHMPVQGPDAGKVMLVRADLQRGKRHAEVCHDVRIQRANKPKPEAWTGDEFGVPETAAQPLSWVDQAERVLTKEDAADVWERASAAGVSEAELDSLTAIMMREIS